MESINTILLISRCLSVAAILLAFDAGICKSDDDGLVAMDQIERVNRNSSGFVICNYFLYCFVLLRLYIFSRRPCKDFKRAENFVTVH